MSVTRTYSSRGRPSKSTISAAAPPRSPFVPVKREWPLGQSSNDNIPRLTKRPRTVSTQKPRKVRHEKQKTLTQLHFCIDQTILRTCHLCDLTYVKGAPDDEALHRAHCARVQKGMEWGKEESKEAMKANVVEVANGVKLTNGQKGRIVCFPSDIGGKIGSKQSVLLGTINLALSSPALPPATRRVSKTYLFLLPCDETGHQGRERIVGCVIAERISHAMAIAPGIRASYPNASERKESTPSSVPQEPLVAVDFSTGLFCYPELLPTPMGIPRLFVASSHRRQGIARHTLSAASRTFIHGCPLDPEKGEIAFSQPTGDGMAIMQEWGGGGVRIYRE